MIGLRDHRTNARSRSRRGASHGLRTDRPVVPSESPEQWEAHRAAILQLLAPSGGLETALDERIALHLWRLGRVAAYETAVVTAGTEDAEAQPGDGADS